MLPPQEHRMSKRVFAEDWYSNCCGNFCMPMFAICVYDLDGFRCKQETMRELFGWWDNTHTSLLSAGINILYNHKHEGIREWCSSLVGRTYTIILMQFNSISSLLGVPWKPRGIFCWWYAASKKSEPREDCQLIWWYDENIWCHNKQQTEKFVLKSKTSLRSFTHRVG